MSLYNMLHGSNNQGAMIFKLSNLENLTVGRFRDVWLDAERKVTCVYTRLGGGNRECYCDTIEAHENHGCYQPTIAAMQAHPQYVNDYDDDFDCTYATFEYRWPEESVAALEALAALNGQSPKSGDARWQEVFKALGIPL